MSGFWQSVVEAKPSERLKAESWRAIDISGLTPTVRCGWVNSPTEQQSINAGIDWLSLSSDSTDILHVSILYTVLRRFTACIITRHCHYAIRMLCATIDWTASVSSEFPFKGSPQLQWMELSSLVPPSNIHFHLQFESAVLYCLNYFIFRLKITLIWLYFIIFIIYNVILWRSQSLADTVCLTHAFKCSIIHSHHHQKYKRLSSTILFLLFMYIARKSHNEMS